jgi:hypothetical protein
VGGGRRGVGAGMLIVLLAKCSLWPSGTFFCRIPHISQLCVLTCVHAYVLGCAPEIKHLDNSPMLAVCCHAAINCITLCSCSLPCHVPHRHSHAVSTAPHMALCFENQVADAAVCMLLCAGIAWVQRWPWLR